MSGLVVHIVPTIVEIGSVVSQPNVLYKLDYVRDMIEKRYEEILIVAKGTIHKLFERT